MPNESVAVFGLVLFILAGDEFDLYAFCAHMFMFMPKYSVLRNWAIHKGLFEPYSGVSMGRS